MSDNGLTDEVREQINQEIFSGSKIAAVKLYREAVGVGLKESKDFIDQLEGKLREEFPNRFKKSSAGCSTAVLCLCVIGTVCYFVL